MNTGHEQMTEQSKQLVTQLNAESPTTTMHGSIASHCDILRSQRDLYKKELREAKGRLTEMRRQHRVELAALKERHERAKEDQQSIVDALEGARDEAMLALSVGEAAMASLHKVGSEDD